MKKVYSTDRKIQARKRLESIDQRIAKLRAKLTVEENMHVDFRMLNHKS